MEEQYWTKPRYEISIKAERITLYLEVGQVVYIPGAADLKCCQRTRVLFWFGVRQRAKTLRLSDSVWENQYGESDASVWI